MAYEDSLLVLVHYRGSIKKKTRFGIKITDKDPLSVFLKPSTSFIEFLNSIIQKLGLQGVKRIEKLFYRISISILRDDVKYDSFIIGSDKNLQVLFYYRRQFPEVNTPELLAKLINVVSSSRGLNRNPQPPAMAAYSSSRPVGASSSVPMIAPETTLVASSSFAADLNCSRDGIIGDTTMARFIDLAPVSLQGGASDGVDDVLRDDDDDDDVEPETIVDDSGDDIARNNPVEGGGASSSVTQ
ncbi:uncharacterized protein LOC130965619 [Arachis stenosperma]|uniref:uncharacterized protein LOC130965619 n=1 Tax=Arachis stenosperma TaxID=217475 RepID=UPI0025AD7866|nr:uncharacterized protein LOC130965619 [Arachis stenosperma]